MNGNKSQQNTEHEQQTTTNPSSLHTSLVVLNTVKLILKYHLYVAPSRDMHMQHN